MHVYILNGTLLERNMKNRSATDRENKDPGTHAMCCCSFSQAKEEATFMTAVPLAQIADEPAAIVRTLEEDWE
jgi:hypothetical protein